MTAAALSAAGSGISPLWYATRATGVISLVLLTATVILGVAGTTRFAAPGLPRVITSGLHRNVSLLVLGLVAVHVLTTVLDSYTSISLTAAVIPFSSPYRRLWLGLGAAAFDMLLALALTSLLRDRMPPRAWRAVHWLAYACWPVALWHGLGTGTDSRLPWLLALDGLCVAGVAGAVCWRLSVTQPGPGRIAAAAGTAVLTLATALFVLAGPLQPGWARRAGTPVTLLSSAVAVGNAASAVRNPSAAPARAPATSAFTGRARRSAGPGPGEVTITVTARTSGLPERILTIVLRGTPDRAGIVMSSGTVRVQATARGPACQGPVARLDGHRLTATLQGTGGTIQRASATLIISGRVASGRLSLLATGQE
jgi:sulfoxide reductase heme-binding subunit YedZ